MRLAIAKKAISVRDALQPSQVAGKALSTSLERQNKQAWKEHLSCCHCKSQEAHHALE